MNSPPIILRIPHRPQHIPTRHTIRKLSRMRHNPRTHPQSRVRRQPIKTNRNINNLLPPHPLQRKRHSRPPHPVNIRIPHLHTIIRIPLTIRFKPPRRNLPQINLRINPHRKHPTRIIQPPPIHPHTQQPPITIRHHRHHHISLHIRPHTIPPRRIKHHRPRHHKHSHPPHTLATNPPRAPTPGDPPRHDHSTRPDTPGALATSKNSSPPTPVTSNTRSVPGNTPGYNTLLPTPPGATTPHTPAPPGTPNPTPNPPTDTPKSRTSSARSANTGDNG